MNANGHEPETFPEQFRRLIGEAGYVDETIKSSLETLAAITDFIRAISGHMFSGQAAFLLTNLPERNIHVYEKLEFYLGLLTSDIDEMRVSIAECGGLWESANETVSLISLLLTIQLRDMIAVFQNRHGLPQEEYEAFNIRSGELYNIVIHSFYKLANDIVTRRVVKSQPAGAGRVINFNVSNLISLFNDRSQVLKNTALDGLLGKLESSVSQPQYSAAAEMFKAM